MWKRTLAATLVATALAAPLPAQAQDDAVLANVNGSPITAAEVAFALETLREAVQRVPEAQRQDVVLDLLINMRLLADAARDAGFSEDPEFSSRLEYARNQTLRDMYMERVVDKAVTDEAVRARYDEEAAKIEPQVEVSARHILVEDEALAKDLIAQINGGADFATLAGEHSIDPGSGPRGGSLGFFQRGQMVKPFEDAAFALEAGAITPEPVQSRFGWHVIQVDEKREQPIPTFEEVGERIRQIMIQEAFTQEIDRLKADATIEMTGGRAAQ